MTVLRAMQQQGDLEYAGSLFPVHRLDKITSGCLMLAKTRPAASEVMQALAERRVAKYYVALSDRKPRKTMGSVVGDMTRGRRSTWRLTRTRENPAVTCFEQRPFEHDGRRFRLFMLRPKTGKSHQLRVALRSLSAPVLGDPLYHTGERAAGGRRGDHERAYLHACALRLVVAGVQVQVAVPPWHAAGPLFHCQEFRALFTDLFPEAADTPGGVWFPDSPLLRSDPSELLPGSDSTRKHTTLLPHQS